MSLKSGRKGKINVIEMKELLKKGLSQAEVARRMGVTRQAICQAHRNVNYGVVKNVTLENAHILVSQNINSIQQLAKLNESANYLLDLLISWSRGDPEAMEQLERHHGVKNIHFRDPKELALKVMTELRGQLHLQLEIFQTLSSFESVQAFQQEILSILFEEVTADVREKIIRRFKERRAIRSALEFRE